MIAAKLANMPVGRHWGNSANLQNKTTQSDAARLLRSMHSDGRTQEAIGKTLEVPRQTVQRIIDDIAQNRSAAKTGKAKQRKPPPSPVIKKDETARCVYVQ